MNVTLYKVSDPNNKLIKTLGTGTDVSAAAYDPQSVEQPQLLLSTANSDYNYAYISDFGKYYFHCSCLYNILRKSKPLCL